MWLFRATSLFLAVVVFSRVAVAEEIFTWTDEFGVTHYTTTPPPQGAKPADLPRIERESLDRKIEDIRASTPPNCVAHGGVDCSKGVDLDGSVICSDGFKDAILPFRFSCLEVRLLYPPITIESATDEVLGTIGKKTKLTVRELQDAKLHLALRNTSGTEAFGVRVAFEFPRQKPLEAIGPDKVDAFGGADYILPLRLAGGRMSPEELQRVRVKISCTNCAAIQKSK